MEKKLCQSMTEITVVIVCVAAVLMVMQAYLRRGVSGQLKNLGDSSLGSQFDPKAGSFKSTSTQSGDIEYKTEIVSDPDISEQFESNATYPVAYQIMGSGEFKDGDTVVIPAKKRKPMTMTSVVTSEVDNKPLNSN
jgi:hypothetical protein